MYSLTISGGGSTGSYSFRLLDTSAQSLTPTSTPTTVARRSRQEPGPTSTGSRGPPASSSFCTAIRSRRLRATGTSMTPTTRISAVSSFGTGFSATLALNGPYKLVLAGQRHVRLEHQCPVRHLGHDCRRRSRPAASIPSQSGTLAAGARPASRSTPPAGLTIDFDSLPRASRARSPPPSPTRQQHHLLVQPLAPTRAHTS